MFGFDEPEPGSEERYLERKSRVPWVTHSFYWAIHNCLAHFLIGILPFRLFFRFHDWTSEKMHGENK